MGGFFANDGNDFGGSDVESNGDFSVRHDEGDGLKV